MKVAKITLWDGRVFHTDKFDRAFLADFFERAKKGVELPEKATSQVELIEMSEKEYMSIPATVESAELFGQRAEGKE